MTETATSTFHHIQVLRYRWPVIAATVVTAVIAALLSSIVAPEAEERFEATAIILTNPATGLSPEILSEIGETEAIAAGAAIEADYDGSPTALLQDIQVEGNDRAPFVRVTATLETARSARQLATAMAAEITAFGNAQLEFRSDETQAALNARIDRLRAQLREVDQRQQRFEKEIARRIENASNMLDVTRMQLLMSLSEAAFAREREDIRDRLGQVGAGGNVATTRLRLLEHVSVTPVTAEGTSLPLRVVYAIFLGLLVGAALALMLEFFDPRVYGTGVLEERGRLRVLGEVDVSRGRGADASNSFGLIAAQISPQLIDAAPGAAGRDLLVASLDDGDGAADVVTGLDTALRDAGATDVSIEAAPLLQTPSASARAREADAVVVVARAGATKMKTIRTARDLLDGLGAKVAGAVVTR